jgi:hypothetical protein
MYTKITKFILKGMTLYRTLTNLQCEDYELKGKVIDFGAKSSAPSYYKHFKINPNSSFTYTDLHSNASDVVVVNLEDKINVQSNYYDVAILMNVLEHIYNYKNCVLEINRVLKKNGVLVGVVPFIHKIHLDPDDFHRYTQSSLNCMFREAGYSNINIIPLSIGPLTSAFNLLLTIIPFSFMRGIVFTFTYMIDIIIEFFFKNKPGIRKDFFPLGYFFYCVK